MTFDSRTAVVKTFAGNGKNSIKNGPVGSSSLATPMAICPVPGTHSVLIADSFAAGLRVADETYLDTLRYAYRYQLIVAGMCVPPQTDNIVYLSDRIHAKIKRLNLKNLELSTIAGGQPGYNDGSLASAKFNQPTSIQTACEGRLLVVCDTGNRVIRCIDFENGEVSTLCGVPGRSGKIPVDVTVDLRKLRFNRLSALCVSVFRKGIIYVTDAGSHCVIEIDTVYETGKVILGMPGTPGKIELDGHYLLCEPGGICELPGMFLMVSDTGNNALRLINVADNYKTTFLNNHIKPKHHKPNIGEKIIREANRFKRGWVDGNLFYTMFFSPQDCKFNGKSIFVADFGNNVVRIIDFNPEEARFFEEEKLSKSVRLQEYECIPRVYCRRCQLYCRVWNGRSCDRCGSVDIFALKPQLLATVDAPELKNSVKNDIMHQVYFKKRTEDTSEVGPSRICYSSYADVQNYRYNSRSQIENANSNELGVRDLSTTQQTRHTRVRFSDLGDAAADDEDTAVKQTELRADHGGYFAPELYTSNREIQRLMDRVKASEARVYTLERARQGLLDGEANPTLYSQHLPDSSMEVAKGVEESAGQDVFCGEQYFAPPISYQLDLDRLCGCLLDLQVDEDEYLRELLECYIKDDFTALNLLYIAPLPRSLLEFIHQLKSIAPSTLAVFSFEGDEAFPVPLSVNKRENYTQFIDTEATSVSFALLSDIQVKDAFLRLKTSENRQILVHGRMSAANPLQRFDCQDEVSFYTECNLAYLLKMSRINQMNEYCCRIVFLLEDDCELAFDVVFGCGSAKGIKASGVDLALLEGLNQLQIVRPKDSLEE